MSVQRFNQNHSDTQPYHIYYDMNLINNDSSFPAQPVRFQYKETRSNAFLLSPQDYYMSIVRFNLQTPTLPVFIPQVNLNTNNNFGGTYPIQTMSNTASSATPFTVTLYTNVSYPVGTVVYLANNNNNPIVDDASATAQQYYRVTAVDTNVSGQNTFLTLENVFSIPGIPANYPGRTNFLFGGTQTVSFAKLPVANIVYSSITGEVTITYNGTGGLGTLIDLTHVYQVGDTIFVNNAGQYNARYVIKTLNALTITANAPLLTGVQVQTYTGGGFFLPQGDYYNITPYVMTMNFTSPTPVAYSYTQPITFQPNDLTQTEPLWNPANQQALSLSDITSQYYYVYNYEVWINQVNQAMTNAFWGLSGKVYATSAGALPMTGSTVTNYAPPFVSWNSAEDIAIITADDTGFGQSSGAAKNIIFISFNQPLSTLLDSFPYSYPDVPADSNLYSYLIFNTSAGAGFFIVQNYSVFPPSITNGYTGIQIYQDHQTASLLNPVQSIVFTSTILPVVMENVGQPLILNGTAPTQSVIGSNANIFPVVTDFIVPFSALNQYVPDISYVPSGEYRLVDLYGTSPANQVDIQVFWKDQYGILHPFLVGSGCTGSLKLMFRRKNFNNVFESE